MSACNSGCGHCGRCTAPWERPELLICDTCGKALDPDYPDEHEDERLCGWCYERREDARRDEYWDRKRDELMDRR